MDVKAQLLSYLEEKTRHYLLSPVPNEPISASEAEMRRFRLKALIDQVAKMAHAKYRRMPESFREEHTLSDWVQDAMILLCNAVDDYSPGETPFSNYVRFIVSRRLTSIQRDLYRKNPPLDEELRKIVLDLKRENGRTPTPEEVSELTGRNEASVRKFLEEGVGQRLFTREEGLQDRTSEATPGLSPERHYIQKETRFVLWDCIRKLNALDKILFVRHEFYGVSFRELHEIFGNKIMGNKKGQAKSDSSFKRMYHGISDSVRDCVRKWYQ